VKNSQNKSPLELMFNEKTKELNNLQKFGEVALRQPKVKSKES
jgi:hypothetical protein